MTLIFIRIILIINQFLICEFRDYKLALNCILKMFIKSKTVQCFTKKVDLLS